MIGLLYHDEPTHFATSCVLSTTSSPSTHFNLTAHSTTTTLNKSAATTPNYCKYLQTALLNTAHPINSLLSTHAAASLSANCKSSSFLTITPSSSSSSSSSSSFCLPANFAAEAHVRQPVQIAVLVAAVRRDPAQRTRPHPLHLLPSDPALRVVADLGIVPSGFGFFAIIVIFFLKMKIIKLANRNA